MNIILYIVIICYICITLIGLILFGYSIYTADVMPDDYDMPIIKDLKTEKLTE